jgi:uncharacterized Zn finger protein (UPF0148 family)
MRPCDICGTPLVLREVIEGDGLCPRCFTGSAPSGGASDAAKCSEQRLRKASEAPEPNQPEQHQPEQQAEGRS